MSFFRPSLAAQNNFMSTFLLSYFLYLCLYHVILT